MLKPCRIITWRRYLSDPFKMWPRKISHCEMILLYDYIYFRTAHLVQQSCVDPDKYMSAANVCPFVWLGDQGARVELFFFFLLQSFLWTPFFFLFFFLSHLTIFMESVTTMLLLSEILCQSRNPYFIQFWPHTY